MCSFVPTKLYHAFLRLARVFTPCAILQIIEKAKRAMAGIFDSDNAGTKSHIANTFFNMYERKQLRHMPKKEETEQASVHCRAQRLLRSNRFRLLACGAYGCHRKTSD